MVLTHGWRMFLTHVCLKRSMRCVQAGGILSQQKQVQSSVVHETRTACFLPSVSCQADNPQS